MHEYRIHSITGEGRKLVGVFHVRATAEAFVACLRREQSHKDHPREYELTSRTNTRKSA